MRDEELAYDVFWDGTHHDCDADLLLTPKILTKRAAPALRPGVVGQRPKMPIDVRNRTAIAQVLARLADAPATVAAIAYEAGVGGNTVRRVLTPLIAGGRVRVTRRRTLTGTTHVWCYQLARPARGEGTAA
jgi:hypothetical protein